MDVYVLFASPRQIISGATGVYDTQNNVPEGK